ncbi:hypothetical protein [Chitinophaga pinensis]|uniref:Uncharacterized protein n=1 Tax=Chitinophaga pinensis TaxID=79329 RepID=A0A5C6LM15_9BACT|nr:hypothetical protein [Chitinophaga pinensis]TWV97389.1 hypothetical protein FEF09_22275 [Chitinophaga pinensis]
MEIKARFSQIGYVLLGVWGLFLAAMTFLEYSPWVLFTYIALTVWLIGVRPFIFTIQLDKERITITWFKFFIKRTTSRDIQNIRLEVIYPDAEENPEEAILHIFNGAKCIHQVYANRGFEERDFRKLIVKLEKNKVAGQAVGNQALNK